MVALGNLQASLSWKSNLRIKIQVYDDEIKNAVLNMAPWKSPGPDGFLAGFYHHEWDVVGPTVCNSIKDLWNLPHMIEVQRN